MSHPAQTQMSSLNNTSSPPAISGIICSQGIFPPQGWAHFCFPKPLRPSQARRRSPAFREKTRQRSPQGRYLGQTIRVTHNYSRRTTTTTTIQSSSAWLWLCRRHGCPADSSEGDRCSSRAQELQRDKAGRTLEMLSMAPAAPDQCSPWLRWLQLAAMYRSKMRPILSPSCITSPPPQQCVAPHIVKQIPTKVVARPWTEVNKRSLICALPPLPSSRWLAVREHNNILSGQTRQILNPFSRGDFLTTSCSPLSQVNESEAWSSAEASSGPVSLNLGAAPPQQQQQQQHHLTPSPRGSGLSQ